MQTLVLDIDGSTRLDSEAERVDLRSFEESVRYGCTWSVWKAVKQAIEPRLPRVPFLAFTGSGDLHHLSHLLIGHLPPPEAVEVLVIDNHPDNMLFPFGIHCGSWVYHTAKLPHVKRVTVLGITSGDVAGLHLFENHLVPLVRGKVRYVTFNPVSVLARSLGLPGFTSCEAGKGAAAFVAEQIFGESEAPIYLSIDKDALSRDVVTTDWDQGVMEKDLLLAIIKIVAPRLVGADVTGNFSPYSFTTGWKKALAFLDGRAPQSSSDVDSIQKQHAKINAEIAAAIS